MLGGARHIIGRLRLAGRRGNMAAAISGLHKEGVRRGLGRGAGERGNRGGFQVHRAQAELTVAEPTTEARRRRQNVGATTAAGLRAG
jgi:hypothetical protein